MAISEVAELCRNCIFNRSTAEEFADQIRRQTGVKGTTIVKALLDVRTTLCPSNDPLPPRYIAAILGQDTVKLLDFLLVLISRYNASTRKHEGTTTAHPHQADIKTTQDVTRMLASANLALDHVQTKHCLGVVAKWLVSIVRLSSQSPQMPNNILLEAVGTLLATLCATGPGTELLSGRNEKQDSSNDDQTQLTKLVASAVEAATANFSALSPQLFGNLSEVQKHIALFSQDGTDDMRAMQFQATVADLQVVASRSGTMAMLQEMISRGDTVGDNPVFGFLAGRHGNDYSAMFVDLLFAAFHVLGQSEGLVLQQIELYVRNRLPLTLNLILQSSFENFSSEEALTTASSQLHLSPTTMRCAQGFVHACSLHGMISPEKAVQIIDSNDSTFTKQLLTKDEVLGQLNTHSADKLDKLVDELLTSDGNGVAIAEAMTEIMVAYARGKDHRHLKDLAQTLVRRPATISAIALFRQPSLWISPLCTLLDEWSWDDIHGESQPLYDEFGSIFLLILTTMRRLRYSASKLGVNGFVARYLEREGNDQGIHKMSPEVKKHLDDWIDNFYFAEGLSDDVTTKCSPQEFYQLVPFLVRESALAHQMGKLTDDDLKGGLEYLLVPFLLPSLVSALRWCHGHPEKAAQVLPILTRDTDNAIHGTIVSMMQSPGNFAMPIYHTRDIKALRQDIIAAVARPGPNLSLKYAVSRDGPAAVLQTLIDILVSFSGTNEFVWALDLVAILICMLESQDLALLIYAEHALLGRTLQKRGNVTAEVVVHLFRRVSSYAGLLKVKEANIDIGNLPDVTPTQELGQVENNDNAQGVDDIDQMLNESAALTAIESNLDATVDTAMQDMQGVDALDFDFMQDDNMGLGNIDDFDLDEMF
ncbi:Mediator of RNA polymerase II transcription subunit 5 [Cyphellophora attinorum]|uniref:Mediator of RNA polymerase II transcription subunit 5 n=1 Tax=Cyphellophora attinorum TaxID=1664694 RepID=A0A0N1I1V2_9EURO|nr:Mediator of RNA polymerase II transcription subunit 5 [Phialophora attinorum]KPI45974.1 Mediator of RNA polymerase II transcription subunit 5 [Phialophora attinorum]